MRIYADWSESFYRRDTGTAESHTIIFAALFGAVGLVSLYVVASVVVGEPFKDLSRFEKIAKGLKSVGAAFVGIILAWTVEPNEWRDKIFKAIHSALRHPNNALPVWLYTVVILSVPSSLLCRCLVFWWITLLPARCIIGDRDDILNVLKARFNRPDCGDVTVGMLLAFDDRRADPPGAATGQTCGDATSAFIAEALSRAGIKPQSRRRLPLCNRSRSKPKGATMHRGTINGQAHVDERADDAAGEYYLQELNGQSHFKLSGRVGKLRIGKIDGQSTFDGGSLEAGEVAIEDKMDGQSDLIIRTNKFTFREINGQSAALIKHGSALQVAGDKIDGQSRIFSRGSGGVNTSPHLHTGNSRILRLFE